MGAVTVIVKHGKMAWRESLERGMTINRGMVLIKVVYCTAYLGLIIMLPYLTLQALTLGLTYEDISIVYGITPAITFMMSPITGKGAGMHVQMTSAVGGGRGGPQKAEKGNKIS